MHVVIIAPPGLPIPAEQGGSVQIYLSALCRALCQTNPSDCEDTPFLLTLISPGDASPLAIDGLSHLQFPLDGDAYWSEIAKCLPTLRPDVIQIDNRPAYVTWAQELCADARIALNLHSTTFLQPRRISPDAARTALCTADAVVCNSRFLQQSVATQFGIGNHEWQPRVIYPGVDTGTFHPEPERTGPHEPLRLLFAGRIIREKGLHHALAALQRLDQRHLHAKLTVVGEAPEWQRRYGESLKVRSKGLPVTWVGFKRPEQLARIMRRQDILICPSQTREAFGLVNVEAMASGLPVIASSVGGIPEVVDASCGILVANPHQPAAFTAAIERLKSPSRWRRLRAGAIKRAAQFTWNQTAHQFAALYETLQAEPD